ncbi:MBL fold metallo-hydrolase [Peribacillus butanolivorans]|uniref:MBL fold metallo-hydrolase n=1 Tax=Peribacillus butanolivorans TaxID=421767 RepID=UPI00364D8B39
MKVTMLGTCSPIPDADRCQSSFVVTVNNTHYMFDCGHGATRQLVRAHIDPASVNVLFFSHLHYDHIGDFGHFILSTWICNRAVKPTVLGPSGTREFIDRLLENGAFEVDIKHRAMSPKRRDTIEMIRPDVSVLSPGLVFEDENIKVFADYVAHIPRDVSPCFGFRLESKIDGKTVVYSGDTGSVESMYTLAKDCDLLIHECTFPDVEYKQGVMQHFTHTTPRLLGKFAAEANVKNLVATHFTNLDTTNPIVKKHIAQYLPIEMVGPEIMDEIAKTIRENYKGPLWLAHDLMRIYL